MTVARHVPTRRRRWATGCAALLVLGSAACTAGHPAATQAHPAAPGSHPARTASGSLRSELLAASVDLGPSHSRSVRTVVTLPGTARPASLFSWAAARGLQIGWQPGDGWATVSGAAASMSNGFGVAIHDYRSRSGKTFYAAADSARVPAALRGRVSAVGSMLSYVPKVTRAAVGVRADVPSGGLTAPELLNVYNATSLAQQGYTGKGKTIVFFEIDGFKQTDLDDFAKTGGLSQFTPSLDTEQPGDAGGETPMDLEVAHAIVPDAKMVVFDARLRAQSLSEVGTKTAAMYQAVDRKYPGAIWSISLGLRCESLFDPADLQPMQDALAQALKHGTSAFLSSGDTGSLECKGGEDFGTAPTQSDVGLNAFAGIPGITVVGGTALSTDARGGWVSEQAWTEPALQQGTSGGPSSKFKRPSWQQAPGIAQLPDNTFRLTPDVAADADPATGVRLIIDGEAQQGGGTSQAAPIWAGFAVMMNQYLTAHGGRPLGDVNPLLYKAAATTPTAFHDVTLGGNAVDTATTGFDYTTGLGSPNVAVLAGALLAAQKGA